MSMSAMRTEVIEFNLTQRGRKHTGRKRNYETASGAKKIANIINSPAVQERVKAGDMKGFLGHLPRQAANTPYPPEGAVINDKYVPFEPAFRTVLLRASPDGTIQHQAEFFDNPPGRIAYRQWKNQDGGFSAVIDESNPAGFYGFDYVQEPNYVFNRAWPVSLDSAAMTEGCCDPAYDSALTEYHALLCANDRAMAYLQGQCETLLLQLDSARQREEDLLARVEKLTRLDRRIVRDPGDWSSPFMARNAEARRLEQAIAEFDAADLPRLAPKHETREPESPALRTTNRLLLRTRR